jgi:hypothetical protein
MRNGIHDMAFPPMDRVFNRHGRNPLANELLRL